MDLAKLGQARLSGAGSRGGLSRRLLFSGDLAGEVKLVLLGNDELLLELLGEICEILPFRSVELTEKLTNLLLQYLEPTGLAGLATQRIHTRLDLVDDVVNS